MVRYTDAEIRAWPATVSLMQAAGALGVGRTAAYAMVLTGTFPVRVFRVGRQWKVSTAAILAVLAPTEPC